MIAKQKFKQLLIIIFPIIFLLTGLSFNRNNYPNDPEYIYLMNALCICDGQGVGHIDNPGTTLMQISAATICALHVISDPKDQISIMEDVLRNPDRYIEATRIVILFLNTVILLLLGWFGYRKTNSVWIPLLLQASTFISVYILDITWAKLSPEPLLFFTTQVFIILLFLYYYEQNKDQWRYVVFFSLATGAGMATKATFLPISVIPLFILPTPRKRIAYLLGIVPSFVIFTIPAINEYGRMFYWFYNLVSHSGIYGHGANEIINFNTYIPNILGLLIFFEWLPVILTTIILTLITGFFLRKKFTFGEDLKYLAGILISNILGILLVAKHYGGNHYLMPVILLSGITLFVLSNIAKTLFEKKQVAVFLTPIIVLTSIIYISWNHPPEIKQSNKQYTEASEEIDTVKIWLEKNFKEYTPINFYIYSLNKYTGLKFGNDFAKGKMLNYLNEIYPTTYFYELSSDSYMNWNNKTSLQEIIEINGNKILLMNGPSDTEQISQMEKLGFVLKKVYGGKSQNIYILDTLKYAAKFGDKIPQTTSEICFDTELFSADGKLFLGPNAVVFGPVNAISKEMARSGKFSIKLDKSNPFAIDYNINNTKAGEIYQLEVWRKSKKSTGYLVVTTDDTKAYYQAKDNAIKTDSNGWGMLQIKVEINKELEGKNLKIYLWNPQKEPAYFDDLCIRKLIAKPPTDVNKLVKPN